MTDRPSFHARKRVVRNLRAAPAFLTPMRVDRLIGMLDALRTTPPVVVTPVPRNISLSPVTFRMRRRATAVVDKPAATEPVAVVPIDTPAPAPITPVRPSPAAPTVSAPVVRTAPPVRIIGIQNAAPAIDWLRSHGVSVKAASTTVFGTKYLVSNELGEQDVAAIVAIARRKGFAG